MAAVPSHPVDDLPVISAVVLEPARFPRDDFGRALMARSLAWLVGAAVAGVVGDVVLAATPGLALEGIADAVGCALVVADDEGGRLRRAAQASRFPTALVILAGYAPDSSLVEELARGPEPTVLMRAAPKSLLQRLLPDRAPVVGLLLATRDMANVASFAALVLANRRERTLATRAAPLP